MNVFEDIIRKREVRLRSPRFTAEIAREKSEFMDILKDLGDNTLDTGYNMILKTPSKLFMNAMKAIYKEKYGMEGFTKDAFKLFFNKNGVFHNIGKTTANAVHLCSKGAKIGVKQLFAI